MSRFEIGGTYGFLTIVGREREGRCSYFRVRCVCGVTKRIRRAAFYSERPTQSCGCKRIDLLRQFRTTHGASVKSDSDAYRTFVAWQSMIWRCNNKARRDYPRYGGRGIRVCQRWLTSFENFLADLGLKPKGSSLGRIDNDGDYQPGNCRWENNTEQARNKSSNHLIEFSGQTKPLIAWAEERGLSKWALQKRLANGWPVDKALNTPAKRQKNSRCEWLKAA